MSGSGAHLAGGCAPLSGHRFLGSVLAPWVVVPALLLGFSSYLDAVACAQPGVVLLSRLGRQLWRIGVCCRCPGFRLCGGVAGVVLPAAVCPVLLPCATSDRVRFLYLLVFAADCQRSLFCRGATGALCPVLHYTSHLDVSKHTQ